MSLSNLTMVGYYDFRLVALSVVIAILVSYAALDLAGRVTHSHGAARLYWLGGGAFAMGTGIWSMHYIGMLAFHFPVAVAYDWPTVALSLAAAIFASAVALYVASRSSMGSARAFVGSIFMGGGIAAMHYIGMAAMRLPAMCHYSPVLVFISVLCAIVISFVALLLTFRFREETSAGGWSKALTALVMGAAIPITHYTGMAAVHFTPLPFPQDGIAHAVGISALGTAGIAIGTFVILGVAIATSLLDRQFSVQALELVSSEQRYRQIVETAFDAFIGMDALGVITDLNAQAAAMFGWSPVEAVGNSMCGLFIHAELREAYQRSVLQVLSRAEHGGLQERFETTACDRDNRPFPIEVTISAIHGFGIERLAAFVRDVSDQKRLAEAQNKAKEAAEATSRAKSEFLANMSHEIRTPLNGVIGMTDLMLDSDLPEDQRERLNMIRLSADSLLAVINGILDFSKIEAGKLELETINFNLRDSLEMVLRTLAVTADKKGLELVGDVAVEIPEIITCDGTRLQQVITNLAGNSIKFTPSGEVAIRVQKIDSADGHANLQFTVADTGVGISGAQQSAIFEPFTQADASTTRKYGGTGLGLTISKSLVESMGGKIWVESEEGRGTSFYFTIFCGIAEQELPAARVDPLQGVRILVVDDNQSSRTMLENMLHSWGLHPASVAGADEALSAIIEAGAGAQPFSLLLTDMQMKDVDGLMLLESIRRQKITVPAVMMLPQSGKPDFIERFRSLGSSSCVKPIRRGELRSALLAAVGHRDSVTKTVRLEIAPLSPVLRVLVVEDNRVNQMVTCGALEKFGHTISVANDGVEALSMLAAHNFDLVLMDVQMPVMDGVEATRRIREAEQGKPFHMPIIALTAHAVKGDRERYLEAGMDEYVAKPLSRTELQRAIAGAIGRAQKPDIREQISIASAKGIGVDSLDLPQILDGLGGDENLLHQVIHQLLQDVPNNMINLGHAIQQADEQATARVAHSLKGELAYLQIRSLSLRICELEEMGKNADLQYASAAFAALDSQVSHLLLAMETFRSKAETKT
jgi:two-component system sensor histidine kinase/response regulator